MGKVVDFTGTTLHDLDPDKVLNAAEGKLSYVLLIGYDKETDELYIASNTSSGPEALWAMEQCKLELYNLKRRDD